jgi:hypothetical protein
MGCYEKTETYEYTYSQEIWAYFNRKDVAEIVENADYCVQASAFGPKSAQDNERGALF